LNISDDDDNEMMHGNKFAVPGNNFRMMFKTKEQEVDLSCCFLGEDSGKYYCSRDLDGEELISCEDCNAFAVYLNRRRMAVPALSN